MNATPESKQSSKNNPAYDVIIIGAGPVGLFLACELAVAKCSVLVLEKAENPESPLKQLPFGIRGLSAPTIEAFYRRGLLDELEIHKRLKNPHSVAAKQAPQAGHFAGIPLLETNIDSSRWTNRLPGSPATHLISEMRELESVLVRRADALGVTIKRGSGLQRFEQDTAGVTVYSGELSFTGSWLVGCDGSRSLVRKAGGFTFDGTEPEFTGYSARVDIVDPEKLSPGRNLTATGMYFQSQPGYLLLLEFDGGMAHGAAPVTVQQFQQVLRRVSGTDITISAMHTATSWTDRARQATTYRNDRVLLAGDAAHIHSPLGGQGLNLGLGDAMNLGWKLAATIHGKAPEGLLDSYQTERHPVGAQVLDWSRAQVAIMKPDQEARALNAIVRDLINTPDGASYFAERIWGITTHYDLAGNHPLTGHSVPDFQFEDGTRLGELMHDGRGVLLDFEGNDLLQTFASKYGDSIKYIARTANQRPGITAALVRPDGIVAWASGGDVKINELLQAAARWYVESK